jgi:hypothetical protein
MKSLSFSKQTNTAALVFFAFYFIYALFRIPFVQMLVTLTAAGIVYGITKSRILALVGLLIAHFAYTLKTYSTNKIIIIEEKNEGFMASSAADVSERVRKMKAPISGVGSPLSEGFEDAEAKDLTLEEDDETENMTDVTAQSKPAEVKGLFKLGEIPADTKGGLHIDVGTTVANALNALKPEQISEMTKDTKQLIETQKSLMTMLQSVAPMVNEGKQMMETFSSMFGPTMGAPGGAPGGAAPQQQ